MKVASIMVAIAACAHAAQVAFDNARRLLFAADGNQIDAYGSKVNCVVKYQASVDNMRVLTIQILTRDIIFTAIASPSRASHLASSHTALPI